MGLLIAIVFSSFAGWYQARIWVVTVLERTSDSILVRMTRRGSRVAPAPSSGDKNGEH